jgi:hypothetical protein
MIHITWKEYLIFLGGALAVYYLYVGIVYFRREILSLLRGSDKSGSPQPPPPIDNTETKRIWQYRDEMASPPPGPAQAPPEDGQVTITGRIPADFLPSQHTLPAQMFDADFYEADRDGEEDQDQDAEIALEMEDLQRAVAAIRSIFTSAQNPPDIKLLLEQIKSELAPLPALTAEPYRLAINNLIIAEASDHFNITLKAEAIDGIWTEESG